MKQPLKRRVFVAVRVDASTAAAIASWRKSHSLPVRWIADKNLHITLVPPWYEEDIDKLKAGLRRMTKHNPFSIALNNVAYGPDPAKPRLVWATGESTKALRALQEHAESCIGAHSDKEFKLHVTLARFSQDAAPSQNIDEQVDWRMKVTSVALMESHLSAEGSDYEVLEEINFM